jgi:hypothetical protein
MDCKYCISEGLWGQDAQGVTFSAIGNVTYNLSGGVDYSATGGMTATLSKFGYCIWLLFSNKDEIEVDYLINGPGLGAEVSMNHRQKQIILIAIANNRKDCIAVVLDLTEQT